MALAFDPQGFPVACGGNSALAGVVVVPPPPVITTASLPLGATGTPYSQSMAASAGKLPLAWDISVGSLPVGLSISSSGLISGTPSVVALVAFTVRVTDALGRIDTKALSINIATIAPAITTASLPDGSNGTAYSQAMAASNGTLPLAWDISAGALPTGLTISSAGLISGTPTVTALASFTVRVTDALSRTDTKALTINVTSAFVALVLDARSSALPLTNPGTYTRAVAERCFTGYPAVLVSEFAANVATIGFDATAIDAPGGNPGGRGLLMEEGAKFVAFGSAALDTNTANSGTTHTACAGIDGGVASGTRITMAGAFSTATCAYLTSAALTGLTNVPWLFGCSYQRGTNGSTARLGLQFDGDPGGEEHFVLVADDVAAVTWTSLQFAVRPTRPAHTAVYVYFGAVNAPNTCDWSEMFLVQNRSLPIATHALTGTTTAVTTATPTESVINVGQYPTVKGTVVLRLAAFPAVSTPSLAVGSPLAAGSAPFGIAYDGLGKIWITNYYANTVSVYDCATKALVDTIATPGYNPMGICADGAGQVWVSIDNSAAILAYNAITRALIGNYSITASCRPNGMAADASSQVWVACSNAAIVTVYNTSTRSLVGTYATGTQPRAVAIDGIGQAWIVNTGANTVSCYNVVTKALVGTYATGSQPRAVACYGNEVWVANYNAATVTVFNATTKATVGTYATRVNPRGICFDTYGRAWIGNETSNVLTVIDAATKTLVGVFPTGAGIVGVAVDPLGQVWTANGGADNTTVYNTRQVFLSFGSDVGAGAPVAGSLVVDYCHTPILTPLGGTAQLRARMWNSAGALVDELLGPVLTTTAAEYHVVWDAAAAVFKITDSLGNILDSYAGAAWTPAAGAVTPLLIGTDSAGANAARCLISLVQTANT